MSDRFIVKSILRNYPVEFVENWSSALGDTTDKKYFYIVDEILLRLYEPVMKSVLPENKTISLGATETNKTLDYCQDMIKTLVGRNVRKNDILMAIGGGVIQDITAFVASILYRGIEWHFIPTTLLSQTDSCIGSKTSINLGQYKNLIGNFYPPARVVIDVNFLQTLPLDEIKSGIGEILHFFLIADSPKIRPLMDQYDDLLKNPKALTPYIHESLNIKKKIVEKDEFDKGERNLFNYGHTFGHALETMTGYRINHGQAVTLGMDLANYISVELGYMTQNTFKRMHEFLMENMPSFNAPDYNLEEYVGALARDKKNTGSNLGCILSHGPGDMFKTNIPMDDRLKLLIDIYFRKNKMFLDRKNGQAKNH